MKFRKTQTEAKMENWHRAARKEWGRGKQKRS